MESFRIILRRISNYFFEHEILSKSLIVFFALIIFYLILWPVPQYSDSSHRVLDNKCLKEWEARWIYFSYIISTIISLLILFYILLNALYKKLEITLSLLAYAFFGVLCFVLIIGFLNKFSSIPIWVYYITSFLIAIYISYLDFLLYKTNKFKNITNNWKKIKSYNFSIILSLVLIFIIGLKTKHDFSNSLGAGLTAGGISFQLIIAFLLFDNKNYSLEVKNEKSENSS